MSRSLVGDAFGHHTWATLTLIDTCLPLGDEQIRTTAPGTYGPILDTMRHLVASDNWYLFVLTDGRTRQIDARDMELPQLRAVMEENGAGWSELLGHSLDADMVVWRRHDDGSQTRATIGIRLAQALHHGTDHRSQICTVLTLLGIEPPDIDLFVFGEMNGRVEEIPPTT